MNVIRLEETDSTGLHARRLLASDDGLTHLPAVIVAERQTGGVGRFGRRWESPPGGLWCTLVWPLPESGALPSALGLRVGVACTEAISACAEREARDGVPAHAVALKWPNDVLIDGCKVAGALCEVVRPEGRPVALVGVGVNANTSREAFSTELQRRATTLKHALGRDVSIPALLDDLLERLRDALSGRATLAAVIARARTQLELGREGLVLLPDGVRRRGAVIDVTDAGLPIVRSGSEVWEAPPGSEFTTGSEAPAPPVNERAGSDRRSRPSRPGPSRP